MSTTFYGLEYGAQVIYVGKNCRHGGGKAIVRIGTVEWKSEDERNLTGVMVSFKPQRQFTGETAKVIAESLFAARVEHQDCRAAFDGILEVLGG